MTFTFGGLTSGQEYDLYAIQCSNSPSRATVFTVGGTSQTVSLPEQLYNRRRYVAHRLCRILGLTPNASGQIVITAANTGSGEFDVNGFQLIAAGSTYVAPPSAWPSIR